MSSIQNIEFNTYREGEEVEEAEVEGAEDQEVSLWSLLGLEG